MIDERSYRLSQCVGYTAFDPGGRIGVVESLHYASRHDRPDHVVVRQGFLLRRRRTAIPVERVVKIDPREETVTVQGAPVGPIFPGLHDDLPERLAEIPLPHVRELERHST